MDFNHKEHDEVLFLGEWCISYNKKPTFDKSKFFILPDPWSDEKNKYEAYIYTQSLYNKAIKSVSKNLNSIHNVNHSVSYWKILCGPWLKLLINSSYHSWDLISSANKDYKELTTFQITNSLLDLVPTDMGDFEFLAIMDDWKSILNYSIIKEIGGIKSIEFQNNFSNSKSLNMAKLNASSLNKSSKLKKIFKKFLNYLPNASSLFQKYEIFGIYISKIYYIPIFSRLLSVPRYITDSRSIKLKNIQANIDQRASISFHLNAENKYEEFLEKIIFKTIPLLYLEGFKELEGLVKSYKWSDNPLSICTSTDHYSNDVFKLYAAEKNESGAKLKIVSHGGFGKFLYSDYLDHEFDICSDYFTWGWSEYSNKCTKGFNPKPIRELDNNANTSKFLLVLLDNFKHTKFIDSNPGFDTFIKHYLTDQIGFLNALNTNILCQGIIKLGSYKKNDYYQNNIEDRIRDAVTEKNLIFSYREEDYKSIASESKVIVCTYNGTNDIEALQMNRPTIIFWNEEYFKSIESANTKFDLLRDAKIFHGNPESAANHLNNIWWNPLDWWYSTKVQNARKEFLHCYGKSSSAPAREMISFIKK